MIKTYDPEFFANLGSEDAEALPPVIVDETSVPPILPARFKLLVKRNSRIRQLWDMDPAIRFRSGKNSASEYAAALMYESGANGFTDPEALAILRAFYDRPKMKPLHPDKELRTLRFVPLGRERQDCDIQMEQGTEVIEDDESASTESENAPVNGREDEAAGEANHQGNVDSLIAPPPIAAPDIVTPFPETAYLGVAGEFADLHAKYLESPKQFFYVGYLTYLGGLLSTEITLRTSLSVYPRLYIVLVGDSAVGRKSSALDRVNRFFDHLLPGRVETVFGLGSAEGIARILKDNGVPVLLYFDELKTFVQKARQKESVALPMFNTLFESTKYQNHTRDRSIVLDNAHISFVAACTRQTYENMWSSQFLDIGFLNRLFIVQGNRTARHAFPDPIPTEQIDRLRLRTLDTLEWIVKSQQKPVVLNITPAALDRWKKWYEGLEDSIYANRLDTIGMRLMILLTVTSGKREVDGEVVEAVIALLDYELAIRKQLDPIDAQNTIARMEEKIRRVLGIGRMKKRDLMRGVSASRYGIFVFSKAIENLRKNGEIECKKNEYWLRLVKAA
jgi:hypothetical protein